MIEERRAGGDAQLRAGDARGMREHAEHHCDTDRVDADGGDARDRVFPAAGRAHVIDDRLHPAPKGFAHRGSELRRHRPQSGRRLDERGRVGALRPAVSGLARRLTRVPQRERLDRADHALFHARDRGGRCAADREEQQAAQSRDPG